MSSESIVIYFESIFWTVLLRMAGCHVTAVSAAILGAVPLDVGGAVALEATKLCLLFGIGVGS